MKKILTLLLILILALTAFTGCGQKQEENGSDDTVQAITAEEIFEANALQTVLSMHDTMLITTESIDADGTSQSIIYEYFSKAEDGSLLYSTTFCTGGEPTISCDTVDGASYYVFYGEKGNKEYHVDVYADKDADSIVTEYSKTILRDGTVEGDVIENEDNYVVNYLKDFNSKGAHHKHSYELTFDTENMLLTSGHVEKTDEEGNLVGTTEITVDYDAVYTVDEKPYDLIACAEDTVELTVVINHGTEDEFTKVVNMNRQTRVSGSCAADGSYYTVYKTPEKKEKIIWISYVEGDSATGYLLKNNQ